MYTLHYSVVSFVNNDAYSSLKT
jgi:predicted RNA-binding protein with TRAM domain